jgi:hypothetical protein
MINKKMGLMSIALVFAFAAMLTVPTFAYGMWNFDSDTQYYTYVQAAVAGNYNGGKLYSPAAYVKAVVEHDLPSGCFLKVYWHFEWTDINRVTHSSENTTYTNLHNADEWIRIDCVGLPNVVYDIAADGQAGFNCIFETRLVSASLPYL